MKTYKEYYFASLISALLRQESLNGEYNELITAFYYFENKLKLMLNGYTANLRVGIVMNHETITTITNSVLNMARLSDDQAKSAFKALDEENKKNMLCLFLILKNLRLMFQGKINLETTKATPDIKNWFNKEMKGDVS